MSKYIIEYFLTRNDTKCNRVKDFLQVLKLFEDDIIGDAYYDINYRKNVESLKPINLPSNDDVHLLLEECQSIMGNIDTFEEHSEAFIKVRSAAVTTLIIFNGAVAVSL